MKLLSKFRKSIARLPFITAYRMAAYRRDFFAVGSKWPRFYGLYSSRIEAETSALTMAKLVGYNHSAVAHVSLEVMSKTWTSDYPVLFWLSKILKNQRCLFDLGGHIGTKYRAWYTYLDFPDDFIWLVCDLPKIVEVGKQMATTLPHLRFTTNRLAAEGQDILFASGVLQYADFDLHCLLEEIYAKPKHILINKVPIHNKNDVYTLENLHNSVVPYRIFNKDELLKGFSDLGFTVIDSWTVPESLVRVPLTDLGEPTHFGFYLRREK